jgi:hypothetical protein
MIVSYNIANVFVSAPSGPVVFTPINLSAYNNYNVSNTDAYIDVSWQPKQPAGAEGYKIYAKSGSWNDPIILRATITLAQANINANFDGSTWGPALFERTYFIYVTAYNSFGETALSGNQSDWAEIFTSYPD